MVFKRVNNCVMYQITRFYPILGLIGRSLGLPAPREGQRDSRHKPAPSPPRSASKRWPDGVQSGSHHATPSHRTWRRTGSLRQARRTPRPRHAGGLRRDGRSDCSTDGWPRRSKLCCRAGRWRPWRGHCKRHAASHGASRLGSVGGSDDTRRHQGAVLRTGGTSYPLTPDRH
jgi:hypothetical protein